MITCHTASRDRPFFWVCFFASTVSWDSTRYFAANTMLITHSTAASRPGARWLKCVEAEPITGPMATPAFVAAESHPSARARSFGSTASVT